MAEDTVDRNGVVYREFNLAECEASPMFCVDMNPCPYCGKHFDCERKRTLKGRAMKWRCGECEEHWFTKPTLDQFIYVDWSDDGTGHGAVPYWYFARRNWGWWKQGSDRDDETYNKIRIRVLNLMCWGGIFLAYEGMRALVEWLFW